MARKFLFLVAILCCFNTISSQDQWIAQEKDDKYGYVDLQGNVKIPYQYPFAYTDTLTTIAFVAMDNEIKVIDRNNKVLFSAFIYDNGPDYIEEGVFRIVDSITGKMGFANENGEIVIAPNFDFVLPFTHSLAAFNQGGHQEYLDDVHTTIVDGMWGYIDHEGNVIFPPIFDDAWSFNDDGEVYVRVGNRDFRILINN